MVVTCLDTTFGNAWLEWGRILFISGESGGADSGEKWSRAKMTKTAQVAIARGIAGRSWWRCHREQYSGRATVGVGGFVKAMAKQQNKSNEDWRRVRCDRQPSSLLKQFCSR